MRELLLHIWNRRGPLIAIWLVVMVIALFRVIAMDNVYTSSGLLTPLPLEQVQGAGDVGLGAPSVRSILTAGSTRDDFAVVAFLQSRRLMDEVVRRADLKKELFPGRWDAEEEEWLEARGGEPTDAAARRALDARIDAGFDEFTRLLVLEVHWPNPRGAHDVAVACIDAADRLLRDAAVAEGERRVEELRGQLLASTIGDVSSYLAEEMTAAISSLSSIRARSNYAFRVIDPPSLPDRKSWPPRLTLLVLTGLVTAGVEIAFVLGRYLGRADHDDRPGVARGAVDDGRS